MPTFVLEGKAKVGKPEGTRPYLLEKPVKEGDEHDVTIAEVGGRGDGIARIQNFVVFVPGATKGETVRVRITQVHPKFALAERVAPSNPAT